jgi:hypothetical protein
MQLPVMFEMHDFHMVRVLYLYDYNGNIFRIWQSDTRSFLNDILVNVMKLQKNICIEVE